MNFIISSSRHQKALEYALNKAKSSPIAPFIKETILFGSCARGDFHFSSDVDLIFVLDDNFTKYSELKSDLFTLKGNISPSDSELSDVDAKFYSESNWNNSDSFFIKNIKKDGILL